MSQAALLERDGELAAVETVVDEAAAGEGRLVVFEGPAGIGKTRLLDETRRTAGAAGMRVLSARAGVLEREFPYGVVRQLFEPALVDPEAREGLLGESADPARAVFESAEPGAADSGEFATLHGLYWLTVNMVAGRPLMLAIDDLQWCDRPSLRFVAYLLRRIEGMGVLVAATRRDAEPGTDPALLAEITGDVAATSLRPQPLSADAGRALVSAGLGQEPDQRFSAACHRATGGNPLLLGQLVSALKSDHVLPDASHVESVLDVGPRAVSRTVLMRLARLSPEAVQVARAVAVLGAAADVPTVASLSALEPGVVADATTALARAEILSTESPLGFVHPLVRDAVYQELSPGERELSHEQAARLLADAGAVPERVATHLLVMPPRGDDWATGLLHEAGRSALAKGAVDSAVAYLRRALAEPPPAGRATAIRFELGAAEALTNGPAAAEHLATAYAELRDPAARSVAANILGRTLLFTGSAEKGAALAREAAERLPPELADLADTLLAFELASVVFRSGDREEYGRLEAHRNVPGPDATLGQKMLAAVASLQWMYAGGPAPECAALATASMAGGDLIAADNGFLTVYANNTLAILERDEAAAAFEACLSDAHRRGSLFGVSAVRLWRGYDYLRRGELEDAEADLATVKADFAAWGAADDMVNTYLAAFMALVWLERGQTDAAWASLDGAAIKEGTDGARFWLDARATLLAATGRAEEALEVTDVLAGHYGWVVGPAVTTWRTTRARALDRLERTDEALELLDEELALARAQGAPGPIGRVLWVRGSLQRRGGEESLREAVEVLDRSSARLERAKAWGALGGWLRRERRPSDAREPLRKALELAEACGAEPLSVGLRTELRASGARPRSSAMSGLDSLTASERRVASLAAGGQTNRDIAQELFVTPKTVEVHLSNTYRKLGLRSRRELPAALAA
ncbi:MAG TPA: AAA family ATPase [Thermoleophilaceae bacterium]|nr:AAA family ATPase [Thermoleophilaceae bacterium]